MTTPKPIEPEKKFAEKLNGRLAMLGLVAGTISYIATGRFFFGGILGF